MFIKALILSLLLPAIADADPILRLLPDGVMYGSVKVGHLEDIDLDNQILDSSAGNHWVVLDFYLGMSKERERCLKHHYYVDQAGEIYLLKNKHPNDCDLNDWQPEEFKSVFRDPISN